MLFLTTIQSYYSAEIRNAYELLFFAAIMLVLTLFLYKKYKTDFWKGLFIPTALVATLFVFLGGYNLQILGNKSEIVMNAALTDDHRLLQEEYLRIMDLQNYYIQIRYIEAGLFFVGSLVIFFMYRFSKFWVGIGMSLILCAILATTIDTLSQNRAEYFALDLQKYILETK